MFSLMYWWNRIVPRKCNRTNAIWLIATKHFSYALFNKCADEMKQLKYYEVYFTITNPLPVALTGGVFELVGSGIEGAAVKVP